MNGSLIPTPFGLLGLVRDSNNVVHRLLLPPVSPETVRKEGGRHARQESPTDEVARAIVRYFEGAKDPLSFWVDLSQATEFQRQVYKTVRAIPYGQTRTYGQVALAVGRPAGARAVGMAMACNPVPLAIPCHRVVATGGRIGGFSAPGGTRLKEQLLALERNE